MGTTFIYALCEPDTGEIRYIGKADDPHRRFLAHLSKSHKEDNYKSRWIRNLQHSGKTPVLKIIDEVSLETWQQCEVAYVEFCLEQECHLTNGTLGGEGGHNPTLEVRKKMSLNRLGKKAPESACIKRSILFTGAGNPRFGKEVTLATRAKMSAARKGKQTGADNPMFGKRGANFGKKFSLETCKKISKSKNNLSDVTRKKMSDAQKLYQEKRRQEMILAEMWR